MRYLFILLMVISFASLASAQDKTEPIPPVRDFFPITYQNTNDLKVAFNEIVPTLKTSTDLRVVVIYYKGSKRNRSDFNSFKSKIQKILVKSHKIEAERVFILDSGNDYYDFNSFRIRIVDKDGIPVD